MFNELWEIKKSLKTHGNRAFLKSDDNEFITFFLICKVSNGGSILKILYRVKALSKLIHSFLSGYSKIQKQNKIKLNILQNKLLDCDCCWRHACNKNTVDYVEVSDLSSKEKCFHYNCTCPCRHYYRRVMWLKESIKLVEFDCPNLKLLELWNRYR